MEQSLKAGRALYWSVLVASATVLLFGMSPDPRSQYWDAYHVVEDIQRVDFQSFRSWSVDKQREDAPTQRQVVSSLLASIEANGGPRCSVSSSLSLADDGISWGTWRYYEGGPSLDNTLDELNEYIRKDYAVRRLAIPIDRLAQTIADRIPGEGPKVLTQIFFQGLPSEGTVTATMYLKDRGDSVGSLGTKLVASAQIDVIPVNSHSLHSWLKGKAEFATWVDGPKSDDPFGALRPFWVSLQQKRPDEAMSWIQERIQELGSERVVSLFGFEMNERQAAIAGPGLSGALLMFLFAHLLHLRSLPSHNDERRQYPWLIVLPGFPNAVLRGVTVVALPVAANLCLMLRTPEERDMWSWVLCGLMAIAALGVWWMATVLARDLTSQPAGSRTSAIR